MGNTGCWIAHNLIIMIKDKLIIETDHLEKSCKNPRISDEQKTCYMSNRWPLCLPFLPVLEFTGAESVTGKVSLVQCGYFFFGDLKKVFKVILWNKIIG